MMLSPSMIPMIDRIALSEYVPVRKISVMLSIAWPKYRGISTYATSAPAVVV